jgi:hypothetical protein
VKPTVLSTVKRLIATPFEDKQQSDDYNFTGVERSLSIFLDIYYLFINMKKQFNDKIKGMHWILLSRF